MALSDLAVFSDHMYMSYSEVLMQQIDLFNAATRNSIVLSSKANVGDYNEEAYWKKMNGLVRRRNAYGTGAVTEINLEHLINRSVKIASGTPPVDLSPGQLDWIQRSQSEAGSVIGQQLAKDMLADMLNTAILSARSALSQVSAVVYDGTGDTINTMNSKQLIEGSRLFGDQSQNITTWIMHSKAMHDFYSNALDNSNRLFQYGTVNVVSDPMGRYFIVSDIPGLSTAGTPDTYHTLGLTSGAVIVEQNADFNYNIDTANGNENIKSTYQAEWSYNLAIKGFSWDKTNGGASPNDAALAVGTNWDRYSTDVKSLAGVIVDTR